MANNVKVLEIDGKKLKRLLLQREVDVQELSRDLGYNSQYVTDSIRQEVMSTTAIKGIEYLVGIKYSEYQKDNEKFDASMYTEDYLRMTIKRLCRSQAVLGAAIGRSDSYINSWLNGKNVITVADVMGIADTLNLDAKRIPRHFVETVNTTVKDVEVVQEKNNDDIIDRLDKIIELQEKMCRYFAHLIAQNKKVESFEETVAKTRAESTVMTVPKKEEK